MILLDVKQGSPEWIAARIGIPTASHFGRILTPATRKVSAQAKEYMMSLLAEWLIGEPADVAVTGFMDRGTELEPLARAWYANERDVEVKPVGCVLRDDRLVGASPDGLVGEDGSLEIKCPSAKVHVSYLLEGLPTTYFAQIQGALWLTGRQWTDLLAYHPELPPVVARILRDEDYIAALDAAVSAFVETMLRTRDALLALGCQPSGRLTIPASMATDDPF